MCGLAGFLSFTADASIDAVTLRRMTRSLAHRGPNDSGCIVIGDRGAATSVFRATDGGVSAAGPVGWGHRRLSIIDLSDDGRQPMSAADNAVWLVFNGEIYNYIELRSELISLGHAFRTATDTEVVLHAYLQWGGS